MGYRNYIGSIKKTEYDKIRSLTVKQLIAFYNKGEEENHVSHSDIVDEIYEFGKYCDFEIDDFKTPLFKKKKTHDHINEDCELVVLSKEGLAKIIENYRNKNIEYYKSMYKPFEDKDERFKFGQFITLTDEQKEAIEKIRYLLISKFNEWTMKAPYNLENGDEVTDSWSYEYSIFELVRIYKTFDWKNKILIYYGH
jgi:hypothetical protein